MAEPKDVLPLLAYGGKVVNHTLEQSISAGFTETEMLARVKEHNNQHDALAQIALSFKDD